MVSQQTVHRAPTKERSRPVADVAHRMVILRDGMAASWSESAKL
jgi:hypothetical protein